MPRPPRPPRPPRRPRVPSPPSPPRPSLPRPLSLSPIRTPGSVELDDATTKQGRLGDVIPFERWDVFSRRFRFRQGEHITIVGTTGSGKTLLARELLAFRDYVVVLGTKNTDPELYGPFEKSGYEVTDRFEAVPEKDQTRVIFRPRISSPDEAGRKRQAEAFNAMLFEVWEAGGWTVYADEIWYLTNRLNLAPVFETFWTAGRTEGISVVASTQQPVRIPLLAFDQATHLFLFRNTDRVRIQRMAEFAGADVDLVRYVIPRLPSHEFLYVDTRTGVLIRSKVILRAR